MLWIFIISSIPETGINILIKFPYVFSIRMSRDFNSANVAEGLFDLTMTRVSLGMTIASSSKDMAAAHTRFFDSSNRIR
jgi:hypothetical protein